MSLNEPKPIRIILLEDNPADAKLVGRMLTQAGMGSDFKVARNEQEFKSLVREHHADVILGDYRLPMWSGLDALSWLRDNGFRTPFILVTGSIGDELAVECIKKGATDYLLKDHLDRLPLAVERAIHEATLTDQRDHAEHELRASEKQYRMIIKGAPYGFYKSDSDGNVLVGNPALATMLGYQDEQELLVLNTARDFYADPADRLAALPLWSGETITSIQTKFKCKDGSLITVRLAGRSPQVESPAAKTYEVFVENITERILLEEQFQRAQRMEAIGRFAGGIAHDFNNLLMVINSSTELIDAAKDPEKTSRFTDMIRKAVSKAAGMTRRLLAFSRQQVMQPVVLSLNDVVTDLCKMLPQLLGEDIDLVLELEDDLHNVSADRGQLEQVLMNLAVNARDAMPEGGKLTVATNNVELDSAYPLRKGLEIAPGYYVVLAVTDTGTGMDEATQARIFEPFFTTKEPGKGTGLGLASVYGIVQQSGGFIWVYSELGKGTTFKVYLPIVGEKLETHVEAASEHAAGGSETILLVEDEVMLRSMMSDYLHAKGYRVIEATNAAEALEKWKDQPVQLLISDVVMPGISGPQLYEKLKVSEPELRVIFISGYADRSNESLNLEAFAYLQKPFGLEVLARKIRSVLTAENS